MNKSKFARVCFTICGFLIPVIALAELAIIIFGKDFLFILFGGVGVLALLFLMLLLTYALENMMIRYCDKCNAKVKRSALEIKLDKVQQFGKKNSFSYVYSLKGKCECGNIINQDLFIKAKDETSANEKLEKRLKKIFKGEQND